MSLNKETLWNILKFFWGVIVVISAATSLALLLIAWFNFQNNPTILVTDSTHHPIWNYPFPAVTICSFNKFSKNKVEALAKKLYIPPGVTQEEVVHSFKILFQLIYNNNNEIPYRNYSRLQDILDSNEISIDEVMKTIVPSCSDIVQRCKWKGEEKRCESIFEAIKTSEGYCCTFNYYALKNHTFAGVLANKIPKFPRRVAACGYFTALEVLVNSQPENYFVTQVPSIGHRILIHNSYHFPDWTIQNMLTEKGINNLIGVTPSITYSSPSVSGIEVAKRRCWFSNETQLHNFGVYTFQNCMTECRMNLTKQYCGCIPFYYQHEIGSFPKTRTCNLRDISCLSEHKLLIMSSVPGYDFSAVPKGHEWGKEKSLCPRCLPDCDHVEYAAEASSGVFTREFSTNQMNLFGGITIKHQSVVRVYFNDLVATRNRRDVVFSWHTLLAYYGGLLGLFIGFSFVSAIELIYYFTVRLVIDFRNQRNGLKQKKKDNRKPNQFVTVKPQHEEVLNPKHFMNDPNFNNRLTLRRRSNSNSQDK